jgi:hypothetical protein
MIDIVQFINTQEPVKSWTNAKKQGLLDRFCKARGYQETIYGEPNTQTKKDFMNQELLNYVKIMFEADAEREAREALIIEELTFE